MALQNTNLDRPMHGHHKIAAAIFVASLILGAAAIMSAELVKPERYEYHNSNDPKTYVIYDRDTGKATMATFDSKDPVAPLSK